MASPLLRLLHFLGAKTVAALWGFFDESGIHTGSKIIAVGGLVGPEEEWVLLERQWKNILLGAEVKVFHFSDCDNGWGEFAGWTYKQKAELVSKLIAAIVSRNLFGVSGVIALDDYAEISKGSGTILEEKPMPYQICLQYCIEAICNRVNEKVFYVFDQQREYVSPINETFFKIQDACPKFAPKMGGMTFQSKATVRPLQAADLIAYETAKSLKNFFYEPDRPSRKSWAALLKMKDRLVGGYYDKRNLHQILGVVKVKPDAEKV